MSHTAAAVTVQSTPGLWATLREAVRGSHQDYTEAPVGQAVILLAVPMVLEMLMESVFAVADIFFVGRLGADAVATVGITESLMTIMYALAIGLSIGGDGDRRAAHRREGSRRRGARRRCSRSRSACWSASPSARSASLFGPQLLALMGASDEVRAHRLDVRARDARRQRHASCCSS